MPVYLTSRLPQINAASSAKASQAVQKAVADVETTAKSLAPVDTGNHRSLIQGQMTGEHSGVVNAGAHYAIYLEFGTYKMAARPSMIPAAEAASGPFMAAMADIVS